MCSRTVFVQLDRDDIPARVQSPTSPEEWTAIEQAAGLPRSELEQVVCAYAPGNDIGMAYQLWASSQAELLEISAVILQSFDAYEARFGAGSWTAASNNLVHRGKPAHFGRITVRK